MRLTSLIGLGFCCLLWTGEVNGQDRTSEPPAKEIQTKIEKILKPEPVRTDSPQETIRSFLRIRGEVEKLLLEYQTGGRQGIATRWNLILAPQFRSLLDLSLLPTATRDDIGLETVGYLLDIFGRVDLPPIDQIPNEEGIDSRTSAIWRVPGTPIKIVRIEKGPRASEFLFSSVTPDVAPRFYRQIAHLPLRSRIGIISWRREMLQSTGPLFPRWLVASIPEFLKTPIFGAAGWKLIIAVSCTALAMILIWIWHHFLIARQYTGRIGKELANLMLPLGVMLLAKLLDMVCRYQLNLTGAASNFVTATVTVATYLAGLWIFWLSLKVFAEALILSPKIPDHSLDANLIRLIAKVFGVVGSVLIVGVGAQELGLPFLSVLTGLGVGGVAVALAVRPTLENLFGGMILYLDKPVQVGDFCSFGDKTGTVESIGVRSTRVRALDRTTISIPNAQLADMEITNWARCDRMLIHTTIGLRYETVPDQLRYTLAKLREMFHAHPKIDRETIRVRFAGYGGSSLDIDIRIYALTREWNTYYAIREDVFLRISDIVQSAGTDFAFESRTLYLKRDNGIDEAQQQAAAHEVRSWRKSGQLPFPRFTKAKMDELEGSLDYPPDGSSEASNREASAGDASELLSGENLINE